MTAMPRTRLYEGSSSKRPRATLCPMLVVVLWGIGNAFAQKVPPTINYSRDVEPILSDTCYHCHGPDGAQRKADLRLDRHESVLAAHDGHIAVTPGSLEKSELVKRIVSSDPDEKMPPPKSNRSLTAQQIETLKRWVEQGAVWGKHWAYEKPVRPELPAVKDAAWCRNAIDYFILANLEKDGLHPAAEASKAKLLRRVTFDLTGLPPTPEELDQFLGDSSADAYERVVDHLLASPHYGENWARQWLDAARYSDSNGYQEDRTRTVWPWRDWVVRAMNDNMPFNEFVVEQLAGDLLPGATNSQKLATAFNRNHMLNGEGGSIAEESRVGYVIDRVNTTATVFLGSTIQCCQCHDHKYDPFTQKNYYQFFSYFNNLPESGSVDAGGNANPVMRVESAEQERTIAGLKKKSKAAEDALAAAMPGIDAGESQWETEARDAGTWTVSEPAAVTSKNGASLTRLPDGSVLASGTSPPTDVYELDLRTDLTAVRALRLEAIADDALPHGGPGRSEDTGNFVLTNLEAEAVSVAHPNERRRVAFGGAEATYSQEGWDIKGAIDGDSKTGWAVWNAPDKKNLAAIFTLSEPVGFAGGTQFHLVFHFDSSPNKQHTLGRFRLSLTSGSPLPPQLAGALSIDPDKRNEQQKKEIKSFYREHVSAQFQSLNSAVVSATREVEEYEKKLPEVMVMEDSNPRETHLLIRGTWDKPGPAVQPGVPEELGSLPPGAPNNRLGLARWILDADNPLCARVTVNRYWQGYFGTGLVKTAEDFGTQGERPSHPKLLDWLATEFMQNGWNVKAMHRLIVTSATYRQSSNVTPDMLERDPDNRLLARGPRHRLSAYELRDQALAVSGLLVDQVGGPPVYPYQPPNLWEEFSFGKIKYEQDHGDKLYRRSLYTFWRRTMPPTMMFDTASRQVCTVRKSNTNTPLQSLILLNETGYMEDARVLSQKLLADENLTDEQRIAEVFRRCTARKPNEQELKVLLDTLHHLQAQYRDDKDDAMKLIATGESPRDIRLNPLNLAAYTSLVNMIFNLDETLTDN